MRMDISPITPFTPSSDAAVLGAPLTLPCGVTLPNRLAKGAMSELLADAENRSTAGHERLYRAFAKGGVGLLLTGNVQVDRMHLEHGGNVVIEGEQDADRLDGLKRWSTAGKSGGGQVWMQLAHAGRQTQKSINPAPKAPSSVEIDLPGNKFGTPVALTDLEIRDLIRRFGDAAVVARETGFDGVELHAAHGYLFSAFLSPRTNLRVDDWGGDLEGRARFLLAVVSEIRTRVGADFPIGVKLNSADFQRGGFSFEDSQIVAGWLDSAHVDLIEISGGTYEQPKMANIEGLEPSFDPFLSRSTRAREAFFARFAPEMRRHVKRAKLMVTGGFRSASGMADAIRNDGIDLVGLGRPLCLFPEVPAAILSGELDGFEAWEHKLRLGPGLLGPKSPITLIKAINGFGTMSWYNEQLLRMADGKAPDVNMNFLAAFLRAGKREKQVARALVRDTR
jgi:2,4-dienoyl-CoA reductase-like NADH-dependent reductase (Old Yellow Enzyme family)